MRFPVLVPVIALTWSFAALALTLNRGANIEYFFHALANILGIMQGLLT